MFIQSGFTFNYFTKFYADYYNPLLSEFVTQNYKEIGNYPRVDFFFNAKIQQTRVFIKVEQPKFEVVDNFKLSKRGDKGFGSSGKN